MPHSEISGSQPVSGSPKLIAAVHVLLRLSLSRHPPCALSSLTVSLRHASKEKRCLVVCHFDPAVCVLAIASAIAVRGKRPPRRRHPHQPSTSLAVLRGNLVGARGISFQVRSQNSGFEGLAAVYACFCSRVLATSFWTLLLCACYLVVREQGLLSGGLLTSSAAFGAFFGTASAVWLVPVEWS